MSYPPTSALPFRSTLSRAPSAPRAWALAVFALLKFLVAGIIDLLFLLRSSENLSDSVLLLASAMALGISALSVFLYSAMMRYAEREYEIDARIFSVFSTGCISLDSALTVKELQMRQSGIRFERQLCALEETPIEDTELSTIVMNLLDNAIEAILRHASPPERPLIAFRIQRTREMLLVECRNPAGAASAFSPPSPEEGTEYFIRKEIVPGAEREVYEYGFAITIYTIASTLGLLLLGLSWPGSASRSSPARSGRWRSSPSCSPCIPTSCICWRTRRR